MKKELFIDLVKKAKKLSSLYTLVDILNVMNDELDIRGVSHRGYFASITEFRAYYDANLELIDSKAANSLFHPDWPIYTRTNDSCPTQYFETAEARHSVVSNGCLIEGSIENCVVGRGTVIKKGAVVKNAVLLPGVVIGADAHVENVVVDKNAKILHAKEVVSVGNPGYIKRNDVL